MPYDLTLNPARNLLMGLLWGDVDTGQIVRLAWLLQAYRYWLPDMKQVWDCRDVRRLDLIPKDQEVFREFVRGRGRTIDYRSAIVVEEEMRLIVEGLLRVYAPPNKVKVVTAIGDAEAWLESG